MTFAHARAAVGKHPVHSVAVCFLSSGLPLARAVSRAHLHAAMFTKKASGGHVTDFQRQFAQNEGSAAVARDWEERDFTQGVQAGVTQLVSFLNEFGDECPDPQPPAFSACARQARTSPRAHLLGVLPARPCRCDDSGQARAAEREAQQARAAHGAGGGDSDLGGQ